MRSPIPGRVVKLLVKADDAVRPPDRVVLEAMKMENELRAAAGRVLESFVCAEGQRWKQGQDRHDR